LLVDPIAGIREALEQPVEADLSESKFLLLDTKHPVHQILDILEDMRRRPQHYADIRKRAWQYAKEKLSYDSWALAIHAQVGKHLLDQEWYGSEGYKSGYIPCYLEVPKLFRYLNYLADFDLESTEYTRERAWVHYLRAGQPKAWLYCPQTASGTIVEENKDEKPVLHPVDKAKLIGHFAAIHEASVGDLVGKLQELDQAVTEAGGQYFPFNSLLKSFVSEL
jgi:hypothetical protein